MLAQSKRAPVVIGWLHTGSRESEASYLAAFKEGLSELGWKEGSQVVIEERWADGRIERLQPLAAELAAETPAVIVATPTQSVAAAAKAAQKTPIVQGTGADPVVTGLASSLARPGGMVTGLSNINTDLTEKYLELLLTAAPTLRRVGFLMDSTNYARVAQLEAARRSVARYADQAVFIEAGKGEDIGPALLNLSREGAQALIVIPSPLFAFQRQRIVKIALEHHWPVVAWRNDWTVDGALLSYGPDLSAQFRRAAYYVDRILKGVKPGDLPIEQPTKIELAVNLKTAKALGIKIPEKLLLRADRVIE